MVSCHYLLKISLSIVTDSPQSALQSVTLPSAGLVMPNALVKAAMYEHMASLFGGLPNANHLALYSLWSQGGWGMSITGNVQVSQDHLTLGRDMIVPKTVTADTLRSYAALASAMRPASEQSNQENHDVSRPRTLIIMQLSHAGRQSPIFLGGRLPLTPPFAPSALRIGRNENSSGHLGWFARLFYKFGFQTPRAMSVQDIDHLVDRFVLGAKLAHDAGFDGVELHASHGCKCPRCSCPQLEVDGRFADLLAQFISQKVMVAWIVTSNYIQLYFRVTFETTLMVPGILHSICSSGSCPPFARCYLGLSCWG